VGRRRGRRIPERSSSAAYLVDFFADHDRLIVDRFIILLHVETARGGIRCTRGGGRCFCRADQPRAPCRRARGGLKDSKMPSLMTTRRAAWLELHCGGGSSSNSGRALSGGTGLGDIARGVRLSDGRRSGRGGRFASAPFRRERMKARNAVMKRVGSRSSERRALMRVRMPCRSAIGAAVEGRGRACEPGYDDQRGSEAVAGSIAEETPSAVGRVQKSSNRLR